MLLAPPGNNGTRRPQPAPPIDQSAGSLVSYRRHDVKRRAWRLRPPHIYSTTTLSTNSHRAGRGGGGSDLVMRAPDSAWCLWVRQRATRSHSGAGRASASRQTAAHRAGGPALPAAFSPGAALSFDVVLVGGTRPLPTGPVSTPPIGGWWAFDALCLRARAQGFRLRLFSWSFRATINVIAACAMNYWAMNGLMPNCLFSA
jgi:hypothetical protein